MFRHVDLSRRHRTPAANPVTLSVSGALHLIAIASAIHLSVSSPDSSVRSPLESTIEEVTLLPLVQPGNPWAESDDGSARGAASEQVSELPEVPHAIDLHEVPLEIPPVGASLALNALIPDPPGAGLGPGESSRRGEKILVLDSIVLVQPPLLRFDYDGLEAIEPPSIRNRWAMSELLADLYPRRLRFAGIAGMVTLRFVIDERGRVEPGSINLLASDRDEFAMVALRVISRFQFSPARYRGEPVPMVIDLPISWKPTGY